MTTKFNYNGDLYNIYIKSYIKQQISYILVYKGSYPFKKLYFDFIYLHKAFNANYYLLYFYCPFCGFLSRGEVQSTLTSIIGLGM